LKHRTRLVKFRTRAQDLSNSYGPGKKITCKAAANNIKVKELRQRDIVKAPERGTTIRS